MFQDKSIQVFLSKHHLNLCLFQNTNIIIPTFKVDIRVTLNSNILINFNP